MKYRGFSVVELVIVLSLIGILTGLGVVSFNYTTMKARDKERIEDLNAIALHLEAYYKKNGNYPANISLTKVETYDNDAFEQKIQAILTDIDPKNLYAPGQDAISLTSSGPASKDTYLYDARGRDSSYDKEDCDNTDYSCRSFTLEVRLEETTNGGTHKSYEVDSKNQ